MYLVYRLLYSFLGIILNNSFLILTIIPNSCSYKVVAPKIEVDFACIVQDNFVPAHCYNQGSIMNSEATSYFPTLTSNNILIFNDERDTVLGIQCVAPYPVEWVHFQEPWLELSSSNWLDVVKSETNLLMRTVKTLHDTSTFTYATLLGLHNIESDSNLAVGHYTCQRVNKSSYASAHMTVYRKRRVYDHAFPLSGKNVTVWTNERTDGTIIFPCYVSYQNVTVTLYKRFIQYIPSKESMTPKKKLNFTHEDTHHSKRSIHIVSSTGTKSGSTRETWEIMHPNDRLEYRPDQGFIYHQSLDASADKFSTLKLTPGIYKCTAAEEDNKMEETDDFVIINLKQGKKPMPPELNQFISPGGKAHFSYSMFYKIQAVQITCCSNSSTPPTLYLINCFTKSACVHQRKHFATMEMDLHGANTLSSLEGNCRKSHNISHALNLPLNVRCIGHGIDYSETLIFPLENNTQHDGLQPYVRWEDVDPHKMMTLTFVGWNERADGKVIVYEGQKLTFKCATSTAYFSIGTRLTVDFQNGSQQLILDDLTIQNNSDIKWGYPKYFLTAWIFVLKDTVSISCYGAVVNSEEWITRTVQVQVKEGESVKMLGNPALEEVYWTLNETSKILKCEFSGIPLPTSVKWRKDNQTIIFKTSALYNHSMNQQNSSVLLIKVATIETHGMYECFVENMFGNATKIYRVYVRAPELRWIYMSASLGLGCFVVAIILLGIYTRRERKHLIHIKQHPFE